MIEWFLFGAIFNFLYYFFKWDVFISNVTLKGVEMAERDLGSSIDDETKERFNEIKETCRNYSEEVEHNLFSIVVDLLLFPFYAFILMVAVVDYFLIKDKQ